MKKVILGSAMFLAGVISVALIFGCSIGSEWTRNGQFSALWIISQHGLMPAIYIFAGIAVAGLALAAWGILDKKD